MTSVYAVRCFLKVFLPNTVDLIIRIFLLYFQIQYPNIAGTYYDRFDAVINLGLILRKELLTISTTSLEVILDS